MKINISRTHDPLPPVRDVEITLTRQEAEELRDYLAFRMNAKLKFKRERKNFNRIRDLLFSILDEEL